MSESSDRIERFLLECYDKNRERKGVCWKVKAFYASDICIAAHIEPTGEKLDGRRIAEAKDELNALLRSVSHLSWEHDLMRPVAGIVSKEDFPENGTGSEADPNAARFETWESDQDWHRGAFTLYVEPNASKLEERLSDLLDPEVRELSGEDIEPKDMEELIEKAFEKVLGKNEFEEIASDARELKAILSEAAEGKRADPDSFKKDIKDWTVRIAKEA